MTNLLLSFLEKLKTGKISEEEHSYLRKIIQCFILIQKSRKQINTKEEYFISSYYEWLIKQNFLIFPGSASLPIEKKVEFFLMKIEIENFFLFFNIKNTYFNGRKISSFECLKALAKFWNFDLKRNKECIVNFLSIFLNIIYKIPEQFIQEIFDLIYNKWRPILAPISVIPGREFSLEDLESYFFGEKIERCFDAHTLPHADRFFSATSSQFQNILFVTKFSELNIFEATLVVHEFQHIFDAKNSVDNSLFNLEKRALNAEKIFLNIFGTGKRGRFCFLESNLFYPILNLEWELASLLCDDYSDYLYFTAVCEKHNMKPIDLSSLFEWRAPFSMSVYSAASMDVEKNWKGYFRE